MDKEQVVQHMVDTVQFFYVMATINKAAELFAEGNDQAYGDILRIMNLASVVTGEKKIPIDTLLQLDSLDLAGERLVVFYEVLADSSIVKAMAILHALKVGALRRDLLETSLSDRVPYFSADVFVRLAERDFPDFGVGIQRCQDCGEEFYSEDRYALCPRCSAETDRKDDAQMYYDLARGGL